MANVKISNLPVATTVDGASSVPVVEGGVTKQVTFTGMLTSPALFASGMAAFFATPSSANLRAALTDETGSGAAVFADSPTLTGAVNVTGTVAATKLIPTGNVTAGNGMYLPTTNTLAWSTNGAEGMRLDASGNVGIGTSSPSVKLHAVTSGASDQFFLDTTNTGSGVCTLAVRNTATSGTVIPTLALRQWRTSFAGSGNVGELRFDGLTTTGSYSELASIYASATGANSSTGAATALLFNTSTGAGGATERMRLDSSGNLGVGASPTANERIRAEGSEARIRSRNSTSGTEVYVGAMSPDEARVWASTNSPLTFGTNDTERARITSVGDFIANVNGTAPTLSTNSTMSFELTSNTSLKIVVRGTDGVTRSVSLTLA